jgi:hypothetical protein
MNARRSLAGLLGILTFAAVRPASATPINFSMQFEPYYLGRGQAREPLAADLDSDGDLDVAFAAYSLAYSSIPKRISIVFNAGGGKLVPGPDLLTPGPPLSVAAGDLNGDEIPDLAAACESDTVAVFFGTGGGAFGPRLDIPMASHCVAIGDVDGDTKPDIACATSGGVRSLLGDGAGGFSLAPGAILVSASDLMVVDVDSDGSMDIAAHTSSSMTIAWGDGGGGFPDTSYATFAGGPVLPGRPRMARRLSVLDLDGDGYKDVLATPAGEAGPVVFWRTGSQSLGEMQVLPGAWGTTSAAAVDFDQDGNLDVASVAGLQGVSPFRYVLVSYGQGGRAFAPTSFIESHFMSLGALLAGDVDGDLDADVMTFGPNSSSGDYDGFLAVHRNVSGQLFELPIAIEIGEAIASADLDRDGHLDLVAQDGVGVRVSLGSGTGTFVEAGAYSLACQPSHVLVTHVNQDSIPDLVVTCPLENRVELLIGDGDGTFSAGLGLVAGQGPGMSTAYQLNRDQDAFPDLLVLNRDSWTITPFLANGLGGFTRGTDLGTGAVSPWRMAIGADQPGGPEYLYLGHTTGETVFLSDFLSPGQFHYSGSATIGMDLLTLDWNADGTDEVLGLAPSNVLGISAVVNLASAIGPPFLSWSSAPWEYTPSSISSGDFDGDTHRDDAVFGEGRGTILVRRSLPWEPLAETVRLGVGAAGPIVVGDFNEDGLDDLVAGRKLMLNTTPGPVSVPDHAGTTFRIGVPFPNPCRNALTLPMSAPGGTRVDASIYDIHGRVVRKLAPTSGDGARALAWDVRDDRGRGVASGVYFLQVRWQGQKATRRIVVVN